MTASKESPSEVWHTISDPTDTLVVNGKTDDGNAVGFVFTNDELAARFITQRGMDVESNVNYRSTDELRQWVIFNRDVNGIDLVVQDPSPRGNDWRPVPSQIFLEILETPP